MLQRGFKEALDSNNEESDDEEQSGLVLESISLLTLLFLLSSFLTADIARDKALDALLSNSSLNHEPLSLSSRFCLLSG